jgi:DNA primase
MALIPEDYLDNLRDRIDLIDLVGQHVRLKKAGTSNWQGLCPFHDEKTPSFSVNPNKGFFKCFGCGVGGDAITFLMRIKGLPFSDAVVELAAMAGIPPPVRAPENPEQQRQRTEREQLAEWMAEAKRLFHRELLAPNGRRALAYLLDRGLARDLISQFGLGYAPAGSGFLEAHFKGGAAARTALLQSGLLAHDADSGRYYDRFRDRVMFPIVDHRDVCVGFGGRLMGPGRAKYLNSPETLLFHKSRLLFGLHQAQRAIQQEEAVVVVEGYMDVLSLHQHGFHATVATLGTALTEHHLPLLWRRTRKIYFCFDGDAAGRKAAWRALELGLQGLEADRELRFLFLPDGMDPDDIARREGGNGFRERLQHATYPMDFLFDRLTEDINPATPEGRAALVRRAEPLLTQVADPLLRQLYVEQLAQRIGVTHEVFLRNDNNASYSPVGTPQRPNPSVRRPVVVTRPPQDAGWHAPAVSPSTPWQTPGRNVEQVLLSLLLWLPELFWAFEEEVGQVTFLEPALGALRDQIAALGGRLHPPLETWPLEGTDADLAQKILRAEPVRPEEPMEAMEACLNILHGRVLNQEMALHAHTLSQDSQEKAEHTLRRMLQLRQEHHRRRYPLVQQPE